MSTYVFCLFLMLIHLCVFSLSLESGVNVVFLSCTDVQWQQVENKCEEMRSHGHKTKEKVLLQGSLSFWPWLSFLPICFDLMFVFFLPLCPHGIYLFHFNLFLLFSFMCVDGFWYLFFHGTVDQANRLGIFWAMRKGFGVHNSF